MKYKFAHRWSRFDDGRPPEYRSSLLRELRIRCWSLASIEFGDISVLSARGRRRRMTFDCADNASIVYTYSIQ